MRGILGRKVGMTQLYDASGAVVPVTIIDAGPCYVTQVKTIDTDGYNAVQVGYDEVPERKLTKGERGHLSKATAPTLRELREFRYENAPTYALGDVIKADVFKEGDIVVSKAFQRARFSGRRQAVWFCWRPENTWSI